MYILLQDEKLIAYGTNEFTNLESNQRIIKTNKEITGSVAKWDYDIASDTFTEKVSYKMTLKRLERNELLTKSDYTQFTDSTHPGTKEEWKTYRQQLRDITKGVTDPDKIVFPEEPK